MIHIVPILSDNYCYILEGAGKACLIIDPGAAFPVEQFIRDNGLQPSGIINTHHHGDHTYGNADLVRAFNIPVTVPEHEFTKIQTATNAIRGGDQINALGLTLDVIETPGHTLGHVALYCAEKKALFAGDTLFSLGCGRVIEGTMEQMFDSLQSLKKLPEDTKIYCGHEYTQSNGAFALSVDPGNADLQGRMKQVDLLRASGRPSVPVTLGAELKTNPFLRATTLSEFTALREAKNHF